MKAKTVNDTLQVLAQYAISAIGLQDINALRSNYRGRFLVEARAGFALAAIEVLPQDQHWQIYRFLKRNRTLLYHYKTLSSLPKVQEIKQYAIINFSKFTNMEMVSKHLSLQEATASFTAKQNGLLNQPSDEQLLNIQASAAAIYDPVAEKFGIKPYLHCFFVTQAVNALRPNGHPKSKHVKGIAQDLDYDNVPEARIAGITNADMFHFITRELEFDAVIWEFGNSETPDWVHAQYERKGNRRLYVLAHHGRLGPEYEYFKLLPEFERRKRQIYGG